jgi:predicted permease
MPAAVTAMILAAEFDAAPRFAAGAVFASTLLSLVSLTGLLVWLW